MATEKPPFSVIDLGSNSVRLSVYNGVIRIPCLLYEEGHLTELGRDLNTKGYLSPDGLKIVYEAFQRFDKITKDLKTIPTVLATEALRQAKDGPETLEKLKKTYNFPIQLLSGKEEVDLACQTILFCKEDATGLVADYGGGSLELAFLDKGLIKKGASLPIGALRLLQSQEGQTLSYSEALSTIEEAIHSLSWVKELIKEESVPLFLLGGSWRALAQLYIQQTKYPLSLVHGYTPDPKEFCSFAEKISFCTEEDLKEFSLKKPKKPLIRSSLALYVLLKLLKPTSLFYCGYGIREGFLYSCLPEEAKKQSSLTYFSQRHGANEDLTKALFDKVCPLFPFMEESFLKILISLASPFYPRQYPFQGEQAFFETMTWNIASLTHEERVFCALVRYMVRQGHAPFSHKNLLFPLKILDKRLFKRALALGQILHFLYDISGQSISLLQEIEFITKDRVLICFVPSYCFIKDALCFLLEEAAQNMGFSTCLLKKLP